MSGNAAVVSLHFFMSASRMFWFSIFSLRINIRRGFATYVPKLNACEKLLTTRVSWRTYAKIATVEARRGGQDFPEYCKACGEEVFSSRLFSCQEGKNLL